MKKKEMVLFLDKLKRLFKDDNKALNALKLIRSKIDELENNVFPKSSETSRKNSDTLSLPDEIEGIPGAFAIFSDGACRGNPGPGAWCTIIQDNSGEIVFEMTGVDLGGSRIIMELTGAIQGVNGLLEYLKTKPESPSTIHLYSDSKYVIDGITKWAHGWKRRGWKKADNKIPENLELWKEFDELSQKTGISIDFIWVKGHSGHPQNEYCDELANNALDAAGY